MDKIRCEIINPSDEVFIEHDSKEALALAVLFLGRQYGLQEVDGDFHVPLMLFGGDGWFQETFGKTAQETCATTNDAIIAEALESVCVEHERTSMNDIVKYAHSLARQFAKTEEALNYVSYSVQED